VHKPGKSWHFYQSCTGADVYELQGSIAAANIHFTVLLNVNDALQQHIIISYYGIYNGAYFRISLEQARELSLGLNMCTRLEAGKTVALTPCINPSAFVRPFLWPSGLHRPLSMIKPLMRILVLDACVLDPP